MTKTTERLGKFDDRNVVYRADDPEQLVNLKAAGSAYAVATVMSLGALAALGYFVGRLAAAGVLLAASLAFMIGYVIWRRKRNSRLTGSPTVWPSAEQP